MADTEYPKLELDNGEIRVSIYLPDAVRGYYRGARFDWSGIIEHVDTPSHRFYAPVHATHDPLHHDCVSGPAEEFAMFEPMGFDEAGPGDSFVKIGVGLLKKGDDSEYGFNDDYEILRAGEWDIEHGPDRVDFHQEFVNERAWFRDNAVEVPEPLGDNSLWIPLFEGEGRVEYNRAKITHMPSGAAVEFIGDAPVTRMVFWAIERAVCPEPFIRLTLAPGQVEEWSSRYRFSDGS